MENRDMDWIGPTCCANESDTETEQSEIQSACCCSLSPIYYHGGKVPDSRLPTSEKAVATQSLVTIRTQHGANGLSRAPSLVSARGPPRETLLSQHSLLQI